MKTPNSKLHPRARSGIDPRLHFDAPIRRTGMAAVAFSTCSLLLACGVAPLGPQGDAPFSDASADQTDGLEIRGTLGLVVSETEDSKEGKGYFLATADGERVALGLLDTADRMTPGDEVQVYGHWAKSVGSKQFVVEDVVQHKANSGATLGSARLARARRAAIVIATVNGRGIGNVSAIRQDITNATNIARNFYAQASKGIDNFSFTIVGDVSVSVPFTDAANCGGDLATAVKTALPQANLNSYDHLIMVTPGRYCGVAEAEILPPGVKGHVWLYGESYKWPSVWIHELGHNLGLNHSGSVTCPQSILDATWIDGGGYCTSDEYGHVFDVMGRSLGSTTDTKGAFSVAQQLRLEWLSGCDLVTARGTTGSYNLNPLEDNAGSRGIKVPVPGSGVYSYYLEYRRGKGVVLSVAGLTADIRQRPHLMDPTPTPYTFENAWLEVGKQYQLPKGVSVKATSVTSVGASVEINAVTAGTRNCLDGSGPPGGGTGGNPGKPTEACSVNRPANMYAYFDPSSSYVVSQPASKRQTCATWQVWANNGTQVKTGQCSNFRTLYNQACMGSTGTTQVCKVPPPKKNGFFFPSSYDVINYGLQNCPTWQAWAAGGTQVKTGRCPAFTAAYNSQCVF